MAGQPITAARETVARDGLAGAVGYGVIDAGTATTGDVSPTAPDQTTIGGVPVPAGGLPDGAPSTVGDDLDPNGRWTGPFGYALQGEVCGARPYTASLGFCDEPRQWGEANALLAYLADQHPFVVGAGVACSTFASPTDLASWRQAARRSLEASQWSQIAHELWTGTRSDASGHTEQRRLASPDATVLSASPVSLVEAIAAMEDHLGTATFGAVQLLHVPRKLVAYLDHANVIHTSPGTGRLWTANDSLVVADRGYPGTSPTGQVPEPGVAWIYGTGVLTARLGPIRYPERDHGDAVAFQTNDQVVHAERPAAISWLCAHFAIPVCYR